MDHYLWSKRRRTQEHGPPLYCARACEHAYFHQNHPDYTVIIKWKDWCAFELEDDEKGVYSLERKRKKRDITEVQPEIKAEKAEKEPTCTVMDDVDTGWESMPMDVESVRADVSVGTQQQRQAQDENLDGDTSCLQDITVEEGVDMKVEEQERPENASGKVQLQHEGKRAPKGCSPQTCNASINAPIVGKAELAETQMCNSTRDLRADIPASTRSVKEEVDIFVKEDDDNEAVDTLVIFKGKVKMSNVKTIYEKSSNLNYSAHAAIRGAIAADSSPDKHATSHGPVVEANVMRKGEYLVEYERSTKRNREILRRSEGHREAVVKCPICKLIFPGDIQDADFNNQFNMHVDSCIGSS